VDYIAKPFQEQDEIAAVSVSSLVRMAMLGYDEDTFLC
jgi:hypothetical protein